MSRDTQNIPADADKQIKVLEVINQEIAAARDLLLAYEAAEYNPQHDCRGDSKRAQGFDLAVQILTDVEHIIGLLGSTHLDATGPAPPILLSGLKLERIRAKLTQYRTPTEPNHSPVELF